MSTELMAPRKNKRNNANMAIARAIINEYQPKNAEEMQDALKDIFGPKSTNNRRNGYINKTVKSTYGDIPVEVPRDRDASLSHRQYLNTPEMSVVLKTKSCPCMPRE